MPDDALTIFVLWERTIGDLLDRTGRFPKAVRFTFAARIDNLALDVLERLVDARYSGGRGKAAALRDADRALARLRVLLRLAHQRRYLDHRGYEHAARQLDETGRMLGGWRTQQAQA